MLSFSTHLLLQKTNPNSSTSLKMLGGHESRKSCRRAASGKCWSGSSRELRLLVAAGKSTEARQGLIVIRKAASELPFDKCQCKLEGLTSSWRNHKARLHVGHFLLQNILTGLILLTPRCNSSCSAARAHLGGASWCLRNNCSTLPGRRATRWITVP